MNSLNHGSQRVPVMVYTTSHSQTIRVCNTAMELLYWLADVTPSSLQAVAGICA
jgi:hypothetical protein